MMLFMSNRHVCCHRGGTRSVLPDMAGNTLGVEVKFDELVFGVQLELFTDQMVRNRVMNRIIISARTIINALITARNRFL